MRLDKIEIGNFDFKWGFDIASIKSMIPTDKYFENENQYSNLKTLRIKLSNQWGIKFNSCEFSAPSYDRLITGFHINLGLIDSIDSLLNKLDNRFGTRNADTVGDNYGSGSVIRNCKWDFENCGVGISIYGGERNEYDEKNYGIIYFQLKDIKLIHELYSSALYDKSEMIENNTANKDIEFKLLTLNQRQWHSWEIEKNNYPNYDSDFISLTFNSLYKRNLIKTPDSLRNLIKENQVCIFTDSVTSEKYIANYWECYLLNDTDSVSWYNALPAKGSGYCSINIGDFRINNDHSQEVTKQLINELETIFKREIKCYQDYDC